MRILVFDPVLRSRLQVVAGLASLHDVSVVAEGIEPIKAVRRVLADVLLCSLTPEPQIALGLLRAVRTDGGHVPSLGVYERAPHRVGPDAAPGADGWLGDLDLLGEFVQALRSKAETVADFEAFFAGVAQEKSTSLC